MTILTETARQERRSLPQWAKGIVDTPSNALISLLILVLAYLFAWPLLRWTLIDATWVGTAADCRAHAGACWAFIVEKARFIVFGLYPAPLDWQATAAAALLIAIVIVSAMPRFWNRRLIAGWLVTIGLSVALMSGSITGNPVPTNQWSGLPLTLMLAVIGFAAAFPLGVALALGRRSQLMAVRTLSVIFIEVLRGVPLIAVLYFSTLLLPLMLPEGVQIDKLLRAQIAVILFIAAYMAEIVRSGLQSVPRGQSEAAEALGLHWWAVTRLVVLPQALRVSVPPFVNLAIGLFLDTTLVTVIGLLDFLNTAKTAASDPNWVAFFNEGFCVTALVYLAICFGGSRYSLWLERYLHKGIRRTAAR
jgi:general L-amino acid transport system permease protein